MHRPERLRNLVAQGDADTFAKELKLDPDQTRQWFDQGFPQAGYGTEIIRVLGTHMLKVLTSARGRGGAHG